MSDKKYEILWGEPNYYSPSTYRIKALRSFGEIVTGDIGGFITCENNLSHEGDCWVDDRAIIEGENIHITGNVCIASHVFLSGEGTISGDLVIGTGIE